MTHSYHNKIPASCVILTYNSATTLRRALESVKNFGDIVILDGGSSDDTISIAKSYGARVLPQSNTPGRLRDFESVRNRAIDVGLYDWFFYIDSDEEATPGIIQEIGEIVISSSPKFLVWNVPAQIICWGKVIKHSSNYPGYQIRFFNRKTGARFYTRIHSRIVYDAKKYQAGFMQNPWRYFIEKRTDDPTKMYLAGELSRHNTIPHLLVGLKNAIITAIKVFIKSAYIYLRYGFSKSMPVYYEWRRMRYQLLLAKTYLFAIFGIRKV